MRSFLQGESALLRSLLPGRDRPFLVGLPAVLLAAGVWLLARQTLDERAARALAILALAIVLWATEALPIFATALLVVGLEIVLLADRGGLAPKLDLLLRRLGAEVRVDAARAPLDAAELLAPFGSDVVLLLLGGFLLSGAIARQGADRWLAARLLGPFLERPARTVAAVAASSALFSMWMSNTATAAMMVAICGPLLASLPARSRFRPALPLAIAFGANVGGLGTPIGTAPNAIAFGALVERGYPLTFTRWMLVGLPLVVLLLAVVVRMILARHPPEEGLVLARPAGGERLSRGARKALCVLCAAVLLWVTGDLHGVKPGAVAMLAAAALAALRLVERVDVEAVDWSVLLLVFGGLSLSVAMQRSGVTDWLGGLELARLPGGAWAIAPLVLLAAIALSTFMSNTATAALLVPVTISLAQPGAERLTLLAALGCSLAMSLPVSTPPNAVVFGSGTVSLAEMRAAGTRVTLVAALILILGYRLVLPLAFRA